MNGLEAIIQREVLKVPDAAELIAAVDQRLGELDPLMLRVPLTPEVTRAALMRVIEGRPPSGSNNEQFRDCCIWEHCLDLGTSHDVHLVTFDGHFYKDKKPENGLAEQLRLEVANASASVVAHQSLSKLVEHLGPSVPPHDAEALGRRIAALARDTLGPKADEAAFILGELKQCRVSLTDTSRLLSLLATFELTYLLVHKSEQDAEVRLNPELSASGSCALRGPEQTISDLQLDASAIRWTDVSGNVVTQRHGYLYLSAFGSAFGTGGALGKGSFSAG